MALEEVRPGLRPPAHDRARGHAERSRDCHGGLVFALADSAFAFACNSRDVVTVAAGLLDRVPRACPRGRRARRRGAGALLEGRNGVYDVDVTRAADGVADRHVRGRSAATRRPCSARRGTPEPAASIIRTSGDTTMPVPLEVRMDTWQKYAAELLGTFVLVFGGTTAIVSPASLLSRSSSWPRSPSASRCSPASTPSARSRAATSIPPSRWRCSSRGGCRARELVRYWVAQFAGGILAAVALLIATSQDASRRPRPIPGPSGTARPSSWRSSSPPSSSR